MEHQNIDIEKVTDLVTDYKLDPNCWATLWISYEDVTDAERELFMKLTHN